MKRLLAGLLLSLTMAAPSWGAALPTPGLACNRGNVDDVTCDEETSATGVSSPYTVNKPALTLPGDLMVAYCFTAGTGFTSLTGFTAIGTPAATGGYTFGAFYKIAAEGEAASFSLTFTGGPADAGCNISSFTGVDQSSPYENNASIVAKSGATTTFTVPNITTATNNALVYYACGGVTNTATGSQPTGFTEEFDSGNANVNGWQSKATAGALGSVTGTWSATNADVCVAASFKYNTTGARVYFTSTAASQTPAFGGGSVAWEDTDQAVRRDATLTKGSSAMATVSITEEAGDVASGDDFLFVQAILPVGAQTISGIVQCNARTLEENVADNMRAQIAMRLTNSAGTHASVLLAHTAGTGMASEWGTTLTARDYPQNGDTHTLSSQTANNNDLLVIELGSLTSNTANTARTHSIRIGDTAATALDRDDAETTDNHPWCDFLSGLSGPSTTTGPSGTGRAW